MPMISGEISPATPEDAAAIYRLLTQAFGPSYLKFTIYQSPKASAHVRAQVEASLAIGAPTFFVMREGDHLAGFYNAVRRGRESFLNYIATANPARGAGVGGRLLEHFESVAVETGCAVLGLDVFKSNPLAVTWYARHGYRTQSERYHVRFELEALTGRPADRLEFDAALLDQALEEEATRGFSVLHCRVANAPVRLGFIGGSVCNLLEPSGPEIAAPAAAVALTFAGQRRWLLATSKAWMPEMSSAESLERAYYMTRAAHRQNRLAGGIP